MPNRILLAISILCFSHLIYAENIQYQPRDYDTFIATGKCSNCNLSDVDLSTDMSKTIANTGNINFYNNANLQGANITNTVFSVRGMNLQNSNFANTLGSNSNFYYAQLDNSVFTNAILEDSNFSYANLSNVDFTGADLKGAHFDNAILVKSKITQQQLNSIAGLCNTVLPDGTVNKC
jgi:uncharacterized protein YjbI with pentapeptide repeats